MQQILIAKLHKYIVQNNADLLISLDQENKVGTYLEDRIEAVAPLLDELLAEGTPAYIIQERCMDELTRNLPPSRFNYLISILVEEFDTDYSRLEESGILTYEVINLIEVCKPVFEALGFTAENEDDKHLRYAITGVVKEYLQNRQ